MWAGFQVAGGVQQYWMENGWAYFAPATSLISGALGAFGTVFSAAATLLDTPMMTTFRFGKTDTGQLIIQFGRRRGGQAVIQNYQDDAGNGPGSAHVTVLKKEVKDGKTTTAEVLDLVKHLAAAGGWYSGAFNSDPLVLDLGGNGLDLIRQKTGVYFDLVGDGFAEKTAWVKGTDGFLVRDLNANGTIDNISEMFGNAQTSGFTHLAALDGDADGKISAADAAFASLQIWQDLNSNGVTDAVFEAEFKLAA